MIGVRARPVKNMRAARLPAQCPVVRCLVIIERGFYRILYEVRVFHMDTEVIFTTILLVSAKYSGMPE
jgi:hypothetical protein